MKTLLNMQGGSSSLGYTFTATLIMTLSLSITFVKLYNREVKCHMFHDHSFQKKINLVLD